MKPIPAANLNWQASIANAAWRARALQKPCAASNLHGESQSRPDEKPRPPQGPAGSCLRHYGTEEPVPFRHCVREDRRPLTAPFAAQLLGQILPDPERRASAAQVYSRQTMLLSLGLDKRL
jgi:hypothetical protein